MTEILEGTQREYKFNAKIVVKKIMTEDVLPGKGFTKFEREVCLLVPQEGDQRTSFLNAWLPESSGEYFEIAMILSPPIDSPCRGAIRRANDVCDKHHIFVMSKGVEEDMIRYNLDGKSLLVHVLPENAEDTADGARDSDGDYDLSI